jgi:hypothetical protein
MATAQRSRFFAKKLTLKGITDQQTEDVEDFEDGLVDKGQQRDPSKDLDNGMDRPGASSSSRPEGHAIGNLDSSVSDASFSSSAEESEWQNDGTCGSAEESELSVSGQSTPSTACAAWARHRQAVRTLTI